MSMIIKLTIPTSWTEFKRMRKERLNKRYRNNIQVVRDLAADIRKEISSNYWCNDIGDEMKNRLFRSYNSPLNKIVAKAIDKIK